MSHSIFDSPANQNVHEEWRPVVDWEGLYEVSNHGRVRSLPRYVASKLPSQNGGFWRKGCVLKASPDTHGHLQIVLHDNTYRRTTPVHVLVAKAFLGERPPGYDVHHINGVRTDNRAENLVYVTKLDHARTHHAGERSTSRKLSRLEAVEVKRLALDGVLSQSTIGKMFGITQSCVYAIKAGKNWKELNDGD